MNLGWLDGPFSKEMTISPVVPGLSEAVCTAGSHKIGSSCSLGFQRRLREGKE